MPKKGKASPEVHAAVLTALLAGQSVTQVAAQYNLPKGTVSSWKNRTVAKVASNAANDATHATQKSQLLSGLLLDLMSAGLRTLIAQQNVFGDPAWVKKQNAHDLAVLHGVITDKVFRMFEAAEREQNASAIAETP